MVRAMAARRSGDSFEVSALAMFSWSSVFEFSTSLSAPGSPVISVRNEGVTVDGCATWT